MNILLSTALEVIAASVFLIPVFFALDRYRFKNSKRTILYFVFSLYFCAVYAVVGLPNITYIRFDPHFNFTPFAYMFSDLRSTILNVILFLPLGFFLPILWKKYRSIGASVLFGFCMSLLIEVLQLFTYRATDINDLMTNTLGTILGYLLGILTLKLIPSLTPSDQSKEEFYVCGAAFCVMFLAQPFLSAIMWKLLY